MSTTNCLDNIIGLSRTSCNCFDTGKPIDASTSKSGLHLDEIEGLNLNILKAISDCESGSLWDLMSTARENAITSFKSELLSSLLVKYKQKREPYTGIIGSQKFTKTLDPGTTYVGERIYATNIIGGVMKIKRIGTLMDTTTSFDLSIYDNYSDTPIETYTVSSVANTLTWNTLDLELNMNAEDADAPEYYFIYQPSGFKPKDNVASCGCSHGLYKYYWDTRNPMFKSFEKDRWSEFVMQTGIKGNDITTREDWNTTNNMMGLLFDVEFKCKVGELICKDEMDFDNNPLAMSMAYTVRYKAGELLIDSILASGEINRYTMTDRERLMGKKNTYVKEFQMRIQYLTEQVNYRANDCLSCNDFNDIIKVGIFS